MMIDDDDVGSVKYMRIQSPRPADKVDKVVVDATADGRRA
jgi:hypothetical protein